MQLQFSFRTRLVSGVCRTGKHIEREGQEKIKKRVLSVARSFATTERNARTRMFIYFLARRYLTQLLGTEINK